MTTGQIVTTDPTLLLRELHATAIAIAQARARNDVDAGRVLVAHFNAIANAYRATGAGDLSNLDRFTLNAGGWIAGSASAAAALVKDAAALVGETAAAATSPLIPTLWPLAIGALAVALFVYSPELKKVLGATAKRRPRGKR